MPPPLALGGESRPGRHDLELLPAVPEYPYLRPDGAGVAVSAPQFE